MGISKWLQKIAEVNHGKSLLRMLTSIEGAKLLADGNVGLMKLLKGPFEGKLVGEDHLGNRYYEAEAGDYNRKRWVLYKDTWNYSPSGIPAEWHGWINYINDFPPEKLGISKPIYAVESYNSRTGTQFSGGAVPTPATYHVPKGGFAHEHPRNWKKVEFWQPPKTT